jgi:hypothetical protein
MLIVGKDGVIVKAFVAELLKKLNITCGDNPSKHFNGLDIIQT